MKQTVESYEQHGYSLKVKHFHGLLLHIHSSDGMAMRQKYYFQKGLPKEFKEAKGRNKTAGFSAKSKMVRSVLIIERQSPVV